jgi:rhodanese-related sulfurtransferase
VEGQRFRTIPSEDLATLVEGSAPGLFVLDVRKREEFEAGHVPGSFHCPVHDLSKREKELPPRVSTVVVVGEPGSRSTAGAAFLALVGFTAVLVLEDGWPSWQGPVETGPGRPLTDAHPPRPAGWVDPPSDPPA